MPPPTAFRVGKVQGYLRGRVWYLCYHEHGRRPRVGSDRAPARRAAADGQGIALRAGVLPGALQLRRQAAAPAALRREPYTVTCESLEPLPYGKEGQLTLHQRVGSGTYRPGPRAVAAAPEGRAAGRVGAPVLGLRFSVAGPPRLRKYWE